MFQAEGHLAKKQAVTENTTASEHTLNTKRKVWGSGNPLTIYAEVSGAFTNLQDMEVFVEHSDDGVSFAPVGVTSGVRTSVSVGEVLLSHRLPAFTKKFVRLGMTINEVPLSNVTGEITAFVMPYKDRLF